MKSERMVIRTCTSFDPAAIGVEQDLHELGRFVARARFLDAGAALAEAGEAEAEQFLELIDDQHKRSAAQPARLVERALEAEARLAQRHSMRSRRRAASSGLSLSERRRAP